MQSVRTLVVLTVVTLISAGVATAAGTIDIGDGGDLHEGVGQNDLKTKLHPGSLYAASKFPIAVKIRAPGPSWEGVQHESGAYRFIVLGHVSRPGAISRAGLGYVTLETATTATPSPARTLANLRATPKLSAGPTRTTHIAGLRASQFDATVTAIDRPGAGGLAIVPFTTNLHCGACTKTLHGETKDVKLGEPGERFRIIVLRAHGRTVVIYLESIYADKKASAKIFPTFLPYAQKMLAGTSFS